MSKRSKKIIRILAFTLAFLMPVLTVFGTFAVNAGSSPKTAEKYESPDINKLTGHGDDPEELSVSAGATYQEKAWYEYVTYSDNAVCSYRVDDNYRILFYDPYTYTNSMIMDVQFDATTTDFDTMSEYTISHTTEKTMSTCVSSSETSSYSTQTSGKDVVHTDVVSTGSTLTNYNLDLTNSTSGSVSVEKTYNPKSKEYTTSSYSLSSTLGSETEFGFTGPLSEVREKIKISASQEKTTNNEMFWWTDESEKTNYNNYNTTTSFTGGTDITDSTTSATDGWTQLSARITKCTGFESSTSQSWSETEGTTVTKTYAATHFAADGVTPLPWAIVHYSVQMPMKCCLQYKYEGEWVTLSTVYCLLTTVKGTCRTWLQNGQAYYEDWGSGEPVVATDFWAQFMTRDQLMSAYTNKLYPVGGEQ